MPDYADPVPPSEEEPIFRYFACTYPSPKEAAVAGLFNSLAETLIFSLRRSPGRTVALRRLLEAKDAAVRAAL